MNYSNERLTSFNYDSDFPPSDYRKLVSVDELAQRARPNHLVGPFLRRPGFTLLYGPPKCGKTFFALDLSLHVSTGTPWHDGSPVHQGKVVWVAGEGSDSVLSRVTAWCRFHRTSIDKEILFLEGPTNLYQDGARELEDLIGQTGIRPSLIVFDTLARCSTGADENRSADMNVVVEALYYLSRRYKCNCTLVHHSGRNGYHERGSNTLRAAPDQVLRLGGAGKEIAVISEAERDSEGFGKLRFPLAGEADSLVVTGVEQLAPKDSSNRRLDDSIVKALSGKGRSGWWKIQELEKELKVAGSTIRRGLDRLAEADRLDKIELQEHGRPHAFRLKRSPDPLEVGSEVDLSPDQDNNTQDFSSPPYPPRGGGGEESIGAESLDGTTT